MNWLTLLSLAPRFVLLIYDIMSMWLVLIVILLLLKLLLLLLRVLLVHNILSRTDKMALNKFKIRKGNHVLEQVLVTDCCRQKRLYCCLNHVKGCENELHLVDHKIQLGFAVVVQAALSLGMHQ